MVVLAVMAAGVQTMTIAAAPARAWQEKVQREADAATERAVVPNPAASEGLPIPALLGGIVIAFAVGLTAGQVRRRRRIARRETAALRPGPVPDADVAPRAAAAEPAPAPPAPKPAAPPRVVKPAPPPPPPPPPPPAPKRRKPEAKPPEPVAKPPEPVAAPPEPVAAPPEPVAAPPEPVAAPPEPPEPDRPAAPARRVARPRQPESALGRAPEVPRREDARPGRREPQVSLDAPEAVGRKARRAPAPEPQTPVDADILPGRRFARERPWPEEAASLWTCEIAWKAGYVKSSFRAMAGPPGGDGRRKPIGESPSLRWTLMTDPEPPTPEMVAGVKALIAALLRAGWQRTEPGAAWYEQRFLWRGTGEPGPVEVPAPTQPAEPPTR